MKKLVDYLFIDNSRLDSYFEQIIPSPVAYDKVPTWKGGFGLTNLGVEGTQTSRARPYTSHEKIENLIEFLSKGNSFLNSSDAIFELISSFTRFDKPEELLSSKPFHLVELEAIKFILPVTQSSSNNVLVLWVGTLFHPHRPEDSAISLVLLQNLLAADENPDISIQQGSPYHVLQKAVLQHFIETSGNFRSQAQFDEDEAHRIIRHVISLDRFDDLDEINFLNREGTPTAFPRKIRVLYRVRKIAYNHFSPEWGVRGIGEIYAYPIFISSA